jgi:hypothetical protein
MDRRILPATPNDDGRHHSAGASRRRFSREAGDAAADGLRSRAIEFVDAGQVFED